MASMVERRREMAKREPRLTDRLNIALSRASSAVSIGKDNPDKAAQCCKMADEALSEAMEIMGAIRRAAESV